MNLETGEMAERDIAMTETAGVGERGERKRERGKEGKREKDHWLASFSKWWIYNINFRDGQVAQTNGTLMTENCIELSSLPLAMRTVTHLKSRFTSPPPSPWRWSMTDSRGRYTKPRIRCLRILGIPTRHADPVWVSVNISRWSGSIPSRSYSETLDPVLSVLPQCRYTRMVL